MSRNRKANKSKQRQSPLFKKTELQRSDIDTSRLSFSFAHLDTSQGNTSDELVKRDLINNFFEKLRNYSQSNFNEANKSRAFNVYGNFPPTDKTHFNHPRHIPTDACWVSFHLQGKPRIISHIIGSVLFIVFIDCDHKFWESKKRNT